jgi:signal transduction histidine kinase
VAAAVGAVAVGASIARVDIARDTTYAGAATSLAVLQVLAGVALLVGGLVLLSGRRTGVLGAVAVAAAVVWFAPVWVGWEDGPPALRSLGLALAPLLAPLVLVAVALVPPRRAGAFRRALVILVALAVVATVLASVALVLVRDPIRELHCWSDCTANAFVVRDDPQLAERADIAVLVLVVACGVLAALVAVARLARAEPVARRGSGPALAAVALAGLALAGYAGALRLAAPETPDRPLFQWLFAGRALVLLALAAGLAWIVIRPALVRGRVTRLAVDFEASAAEGGLGRVLGRALGDPGLRLGYRVGASGALVDADGRALAADGGELTPIVGETGVVALVESTRTTVDELERELGPAAHLALENERLRAEAIARLGEVVASRTRIAETADTARRRMERDLHDGAQQRMLALGYDLRVALELAESTGHGRAAGALRVALDQALAASQDLRDIAHGIFPVELTASGLEAALEGLADVRPLQLAVELPPRRRYRPDIEAAAYAVVAEAVEAADGVVTARVSERDGAIHVVVEGAEGWGGRLLHVEDRVQAAGGHLATDELRVAVVLPLASTA